MSQLRATYPGRRRGTPSVTSGPLHASLTAGPAADPSAYYETVLVVDAEDCSEYAPVIVDPSNGFIWIIHRDPRC